jgi:hypothetical protein
VLDNFLRPLLAEQTKLETELSKNPVFKRLEAVRTAIDALRMAYDQPYDLTPKIPPGSVTPVRKNPTSITGRVVAIAESAMRLNNRRFKSTEILEMVLKEGVEINSPRPQSVVASVLSHEKRFSNAFDDYGAGYGPAEWQMLHKRESAPDAEAPEPIKFLPPEDQTGAD